MILFKSCPKCMTGDLIKSRDMFGEYLECIQCGFMKDLPAPAQSVAPAPAPVPVDLGVEPPGRAA